MASRLHVITEHRPWIEGAPGRKILVGNCHDCPLLGRDGEWLTCRVTGALFVTDLGPAPANCPLGNSVTIELESVHREREKKERERRLHSIHSEIEDLEREAREIEAVRG